MRFFSQISVLYLTKEFIPNSTNAIREFIQLNT